MLSFLPASHTNSCTHFDVMLMSFYARIKTDHMHCECRRKSRKKNVRFCVCAYVTMLLQFTFHQITSWSLYEFWYGILIGFTSIDNMRMVFGMSLSILNALPLTMRSIFLLIFLSKEKMPKINFRSLFNRLNGNSQIYFHWFTTPFTGSL